MLPPFVPPSARVPSESLPLITEFVIERGAYASASAQATAAPPRARTTQDEASSLPSIDEFLMDRSAAPAQPQKEEPTATAEAHAGEAHAGEAHAGEAHAGEAHAGEAHAAHPPAPESEAASESEMPERGPRPADEPASGITPAALEREEGEPIPPAETEIILPPISADASEVKESTPPGARFNDEAGDVEAEAPGITAAEAWEASAVSPAVAGEEAAEIDAWEDAVEPLEAPSASGATEAAWIAEERDAYDWRSIDTIASGPDETRRAEEEWNGTEWEPRRKPENEQVATALVQLARRVRAGEVKIELPPNATIEASLAAVLTALLTQTEQ